VLTGQKLLYSMKRGRLLTKANRLSDKLKFSKTVIHQAIARFKTFGSCQDLNRTGRPKATSQRGNHMIRKMITRSPTTLSKKL